MSTRDNRRSVQKALRSERPTESSATRDSMGGPRRNWGVGQNIDHKGNQDHEIPEVESFNRATEEELEQLIEAMDNLGGYSSGEE